jgi:heterotetrameric sarcosine oxidase gamma subunit
VSAPEPRSPLAALAPLRRARSAAAPGIVIAERACDVVDVAARRGRGEAARARLPAGSHAVAPDRWHVVAARRAPGVLAGELAIALAADASAVDLSSALVVLHVSGPAIRETLAAFCRLDLHPSAFPPGSAARTPMAQVPVLIACIDPAPAYDLLVPATLARSFAEALLQAAAPHGVRLDPAAEGSRP